MFGCLNGLLERSLSGDLFEVVIIAKPISSRVELRHGVERIVSPGHADRGRSYLDYKLLELVSPASTWSHGTGRASP
jgi:hypothetical protein